MNRAKSECDELLNVVMPLAKELLEKNGEFYPFGATMNPLGGIERFEGYTGTEHPSSDEVKLLLQRAFRASREASECRATAIAYDVLVRLTAANLKSDAIAVELDHVDEYSMIVFFPYSKFATHVEFGTAVAQEGSYGIFGPRSLSDDA
jgi:hypothetical protein